MYHNIYIMIPQRVRVIFIIAIIIQCTNKLLCLENSEHCKYIPIGIPAIQRKFFSNRLQSRCCWLKYNTALAWFIVY